MELTRIFLNGEVGGYIEESEVNIFKNMYLIIETSLVYDKNTKQVYEMPKNSNKPIPLKGKENKDCYFINNKIVEKN